MIRKLFMFCISLAFLVFVSISFNKYNNKEILFSVFLLMTTDNQVKKKRKNIIYNYFNNSKMIFSNLEVLKIIEYKI